MLKKAENLQNLKTGHSYRCFLFIFQKRFLAATTKVILATLPFLLSDRGLNTCSLYFIKLDFVFASLYCFVFSQWMVLFSSLILKINMHYHTSTVPGTQ